ncbi:MAG TPA: SIR2 family protein, partial [Longimicrobiaceae bacterium]|nr:SIR2 family protein [Longimicrobiaceae bacterium]
DGTRSWQRIAAEIEASDLMVLLMGERYGWVPDAGPGAGAGVSVTHMEARRARTLEIPILPFFKRLDYADPFRGTPEGERRDAFRREAGDWAAGYLVTWFDLASDLAEKVTTALVEVLTDSYLKEAVRRRAGTVTPLAEAVRENAGPAAPVALPPRLVEHARSRRLLLVAGAGMSLAAGYPARLAITEALVGRLGDAEAVHRYRHWLLEEVAEVFEGLFGHARLVETILEVLTPPQGAQPTQAHRLAVELFDTIVTTNFDELFETAAAERGLPFERVTWRDDVARLPERTIVKISGTLSDPGTFSVTERDTELALRSNLYRAVSALAGTRPLLVVGSSMRDAAVKGLLHNRRTAREGWIVTPHVDAFERRRFQGLALEPIEATADSLLHSLREALR